MEEERAHTHNWIKLATSKGVHEIGFMEEKIAELGKDLFDVGLRESFLKEKLHKAQTENITLQYKLQQKDKQVATMEYLCMEAIQHRYPSYSYAIYLKEQWLLFQIKKLASHGSLPFQNYRQFIDLCNQEIMVNKEKMAEFYMHNLVLTYLNIWDPNPRMGDMKLMALASWMFNEETKVQ